MKTKILITHTIHGDLTYTIDGEEHRFICSYSFPKVQSLVKDFFKFVDELEPLSTEFSKEGIQWSRAVYGQLFWKIYYPFNMYREFLKKYPVDKYEYSFKNNGQLQNLIKEMSVSYGSVSFFKKLKNKTLKTLVILHNCIVLKKFKKQVLFFSYSFDDFRSKDLLKYLNYDYFYASFLDKKILLKNFLTFFRRPIFFVWSESIRDIPQIPLSRFDEKIHYTAYVHSLKLLNHFKLGTKIYIKVLKNSTIKKFLSLDDANIIYPLTYACNQLEIESIGFQHGAAYVNFHGSYDLGEYSSVSPELWFRKILVWNNFWRAKAGQLFLPANDPSEVQIVVGANKKNIEGSVKESVFNDVSGNNLNILVPYEFLSNCAQIGEFVKRLISFGHQVYFKARPDHNCEDQLETLGLEESTLQKVVVLQRVSDSELKKSIDLILVTQTALLFDLLHLEIPFALMNVEFVLYDFLHQEHGVPYLILDQISESISLKTSNIKIKGLSNPNRLEDVLKEHVLS